MTKSASLHRKTLLFFWWCGVISIPSFFIAFGPPFMGMIPLPDPNLGPQETVEDIASGLFRYKLGIIVAYLSAALLIPWTVLVSYLVWRMEEGRPPIFTLMCFCSGIMNVAVTFFPFMSWAPGPFRIGEGQEAELVHIFSDAMWLEFVMMFPPFVLHLVSIGLAGLNSTAAITVIPRWYCFYTLWVALTMMGGGVAILFTEGPFAWNGVVGFWMVAIMFGIFFIVSFRTFHKIIMNEDISETAATKFAFT